MIPGLSFSKEAKTVILFVFLIGGHIIQNIINAPKIRWLMNLVDEDKRGRFTAVKEIISLISGMVFFNIVGIVIDAFEAEGNVTGAFITLGLTLFILTIAHTLILLFTKEKHVEVSEDKKSETIMAQIKDVLCDKNLWLVLPISTLWSIASHISTPFYGTFQLKELAFTMTMVTVLSAVSSLTRASVSLPFGKIADKYSYVKLLNICFPIAAVAFALNIFANSTAGVYLYCGYAILHAISMAGINGADINLIYDAVPYERRTGAIAIRGALAGFLGFFATLAVRPLVRHIQETNTFFGIEVYAQQVLSLISTIIIVFIIIYINTALRGFKRIYERI